MNRWNLLKTLLLAAWLAAAGTALAQSGDVAMVTALEGKVSRTTPQGVQPVQTFTKLRHGDLIALDRGAQLQLVYFDNGRQETWQGGGRLEIAKTDSTAFGLAPPGVRMLPPLIVKQIAKTPALDSQGRAGMLRLRAVGTVGDAGSIDGNYARLRQEAAPGDINPELYLLSALFEMREYDRVEKVLGDLRKNQPGNPAAASLVVLYTSAVKNARENADK